MTLSRLLMLIAAFGVVSASVAFAQGRGAAQRPPKVTTAQGPKQTGKPAKTPANRPADRPVGTADRGDRGRPDTAGRPETAGRPDDAGAQGRGQDTIAERIAANPQQKARIEAMLPSGMTLAQASEGFRNQGQFIAALEASQREGVSFSALKTEMTGANQLSLGQALEKLKPSTTTTTTTP